MSRRSGCALVAIVLVLAAACSSPGDDGDAAATTQVQATAPHATTTATSQAPDSTGPPAGAERLAADLGDCPPGYDEEPPGAGESTGFASAGQQRSFHLLLPDEDGPHPLFVALTGTVQAETDFLEQSRLDELPGSGWIVVAPVRNSNGIIWEPWDAMRTADQAALPNPDATFVEELVVCLAAHYEIDAARVFVGGISIGGTMTNLLLRRDSDLFAGGIVGSGNFVLTEPAEPEPLEDMTVVVAWGGEGDRWIGCPDGRMGPEVAGEPGCVDVSFVADASSASQFYAAEPAVRQIACSAEVGHIWIADGTAYMARLLYDNPKGSGDEAVIPGDPPEQLSCSVEPFVR